MSAVWAMAAAGAALSLFLFTGCREKESRPAPAPSAPAAAAAPAPPQDPALIRKVVERYNQLLSDGYRNLNMNPVQEAASVQLAEKAYSHMAALGEGKARMDSRLKKIDYRSIDFTAPTRCLVKTDETWDFAYLDIKTGVKTGEVKDFVYHVAYTLEVKDGRWLVTEAAATFDQPRGR
ncbi:hypothetical protein L4X63_03265 [Geomonas sp. Red32]|uniref:hypothetical protein n=1 Tax=Geomonas sp. Red32 TaxID=2912856 RepID=UPI00202CC583|nr:hypothetical protein [Geomonas sp. Red32]MCM0080603.1 hypothetical protein [Geomonas sp. Red32]